MRRLVLVLLSALLLVLAAPAAGHHGSGGGTEDRAFGDATLLGPTDNVYKFDARSGPLGGTATGYFEWYQNGALLWRGEVTCLQVLPYAMHPVTGAHLPGGTAFISGITTYDPSGFFGPVGGGFSTSVGDAASNPDLVSEIVMTPAPATCPPPSIQPTIVVGEGQVTVIDATCDDVKEKNNGEIKCKTKKEHKGGSGSAV